MKISDLTARRGHIVSLFDVSPSFLFFLLVDEGQRSRIFNNRKICAMCGVRPAGAGELVR